MFSLESLIAKNLFVCLCVFLFRVFVPRAANFDLCSALMAIEQWGFFCMPHLIWHGASFYIYNDHLRWPVKLTLNVKRLEFELSLPVLTTLVCCSWNSNTQPFADGANALTHRNTAAAVKKLNKTLNSTKKTCKLNDNIYPIKCQYFAKRAKHYWSSIVIKTINRLIVYSHVKVLKSSIIDSINV